MGVAKRKRAKERRRTGGYSVSRRAPKVKTGNLLTDAVRQTWTSQRTLKTNFQNLGLAYDANQAMQKYLTFSDPYLSPDEAEIPDEDKSNVVDLLNVPAPNPKREKTLAPREQYNCKRLYDKHGLDYMAMTRDRKENYYQYTPKQLKKRITLYLTKYKDELEAKEEKKKLAQPEQKEKKGKK